MIALILASWWTPTRKVIFLTIFLMNALVQFTPRTVGLILMAWLGFSQMETTAMMKRKGRLGRVPPETARKKGTN